MPDSVLWRQFSKLAARKCFEQDLPKGMVESCCTGVLVATCLGENCATVFEIFFEKTPLIGIEINGLRAAEKEDGEFKQVLRGEQRCVLLCAAFAKVPTTKINGLAGQVLSPLPGCAPDEIWERSRVMIPICAGG